MSPKFDDHNSLSTDAPPIVPCVNMSLLGVPPSAILTLELTAGIVLLIIYIGTFGAVSQARPDIKPSRPCGVRLFDRFFFDQFLYLVIIMCNNFLLISNHALAMGYRYPTEASVYMERLLPVSFKSLYLFKYFLPSLHLAVLWCDECNARKADQSQSGAYVSYRFRHAGYTIVPLAMVMCVTFATADRLPMPLVHDCSVFQKEQRLIREAFHKSSRCSVLLLVHVPFLHLLYLASTAALLTKFAVHPDSWKIGCFKSMVSSEESLKFDNANLVAAIKIQAALIFPCFAIYTVYDILFRILYLLYITEATELATRLLVDTLFRYFLSLSRYLLVLSDWATMIFISDKIFKGSAVFLKKLKKCPTILIFCLPRLPRMIHAFMRPSNQTTAATNAEPRGSTYSRSERRRPRPVHRSSTATRSQATTRNRND